MHYHIRWSAALTLERLNCRSAALTLERLNCRSAALTLERLNCRSAAMTLERLNCRSAWNSLYKFYSHLLMWSEQIMWPVCLTDILPNKQTNSPTHSFSHSMKESHSWENNSSASREIPCTLYNPHLHYCSPHPSILFVKGHFDITFPSTSRSSSDLIFSWSHARTFLPLACYMCHKLHLPRLNLQNNI